MTDKWTRRDESGSNPLDFIEEPITLRELVPWHVWGMIAGAVVLGMFLAVQEIF